MASRALHGVNLSGWLTLEPWVTPSLFADSGVLEEAELVRAIGVDRYTELVEEHRASFLCQSDFKRIAARGFNAVRLPVPWYVFGAAGAGGGANPGPFVGCLDYVDDAFDWADDIGLKIVLVLAINPGAPSSEGDLVRTHADFRLYRDDMVNVVAALAERYASRVAFHGFEVADDPRPQVRRGFTLSDGVPMHLLRNYYRDAYAAIREQAGDDVVVILPDGGQPGAWRRFMAHGKYQNVWLDSHLFHYADRFESVGPTGIRALTKASAAYLDSARKSGLPVMVGKWSGSLPFSDSMTTPEGLIALERVFIAEQIASFSSCPAWFFQTWKTTDRIAGWDARVALATFERRMIC